MKSILTIAGITALVAALAFPALAQDPGLGKGGYGQGGPGHCPGFGGGRDKLTEDQKNQLDQLHQKFFDQTAQVRTQIMAKQSELNVLMNTSNPDFEKAKALQKELSDLRAKMGQERLSLYMEERKINPDARFGRGWGHGPGGKGDGPCAMGYGHGKMGGGGHRGGNGPGPCWN